MFEASMGRSGTLRGAGPRADHTGACAHDVPGVDGTGVIAAV